MAKMPFKITGKSNHSLPDPIDGMIPPGGKVSLRVLKKIKSKSGTEEIVVGIFGGKPTLMMRKGNDIIAIFPFDVSESETIIEGFQEAIKIVKSSLQ